MIAAHRELASEAIAISALNRFNTSSQS